MMIILSICHNFIYLLYLFVFGLTIWNTPSLLHRLGPVPVHIYKHKFISAFCLNNVVIRTRHTFLSCSAGQHLCVYFHLY